MSTDKPLFDWRAHLKVHPAAELSPPLSEVEFAELVESIRIGGAARADRRLVG